MKAFSKILLAWDELLAYPLKNTIEAIVKGKRFDVPRSLKDMNNKVKDCNSNSPWFRNVPGEINSIVYENWKYPEAFEYDLDEYYDD
jgi:hypothetical protein